MKEKSVKLSLLKKIRITICLLGVLLQMPGTAAAAMSTPPVPSVPDINAYRLYLTGDYYTVIRLDESEIHRGTLILVNADYRYDVPDDLELVSIVNTRTAQYRVKSSSFKLHSSVMGPLDDMMLGFADSTDRTFMYILSAYRDYNEQQRELNNLIYQVGRREALRRIKEPGHSEHHTGLAMDLAIYLDGVQYSFDFYDSTKWFARNAYRYGFILRYAQSKISVTGTLYEPWHYRYVGLPHSYIMHDRNWALEEYIRNIRNYTPQEPMAVSYGGIDYEIFFTDSASITIPAQAEFEISGNNIDGFIVTIYNQYDKLTNVSLE